MTTYWHRAQVHTIVQVQKHKEQSNVLLTSNLWLCVVW